MTPCEKRSTEGTQQHSGEIFDTEATRRVRLPTKLVYINERANCSFIRKIQPHQVNITRRKGFGKCWEKKVAGPDNAHNLGQHRFRAERLSQLLYQYKVSVAVREKKLIADADFGEVWWNYYEVIVHKMRTKGITSKFRCLIVYRRILYSNS